MVASVTAQSCAWRRAGQHYVLLFIGGAGLPGSCPCRAANVQAGTAAKALVCTRADFDTHLGSLAEIRSMWRFEALRKVARGGGGRL